MSNAIRSLTIEANALAFEVDVAGPPEGAPVLLLHGFPQTSHAWRDVLPALAAEGYFAIAPNQRGYSPGARPPLIEDYATHHLVDDALAIASALGWGSFHLVGHDWGGQLAWLIAAAHPDQVRSLAVLSRPHPAAFAAVLAADPAQAGRSRHHRAFQEPDAASGLLADDAAALRQLYAGQGVPAAAAEGYLERLRPPGALDAAINWYRAAARTSSQSGLAARNVPSIAVTTLYLWGTEDATVGRPAAERTGDHVHAPYTFTEIAGAGHFLTDDSVAAVNAALIAHLHACA